MKFKPIIKRSEAEIVEADGQLIVDVREGYEGISVDHNGKRINITPNTCDPKRNTLYVTLNVPHSQFTWNINFNTNTQAPFTRGCPIPQVNDLVISQNGFAGWVTEVNLPRVTVFFHSNIGGDRWETIWSGRLWGTYTLPRSFFTSNEYIIDYVNGNNSSAPGAQSIRFNFPVNTIGIQRVYSLNFPNNGDTSIVGFAEFFINIRQTDVVFGITPSRSIWIPQTGSNVNVVTSAANVAAIITRIRRRAA